MIRLICIYEEEIEADDYHQNWNFFSYFMSKVQCVHLVIAGKLQEEREKNYLKKLEMF